MRRTLVTSKGFHAPRFSGGSAQPPPPTTPASSASPLPPPPATAQASLNTAAPASSTKAASPSKAGASPAATKRRSSTKTVYSPSHSASSSSASARGGGTALDMLACRGALSGHFSANHLRRGQRREDLHDDTTAPTPNSVNSSAATAVASAACVHGENVTTSLTPAGEPKPRKRLRSSSVDPAFDPSAGDAPLYLLPPSNRTSSAIGEKPEDYSEHLSARISRRLSGCVTRNVFYPPPAELTVAASGISASAFQSGEWAHAVSRAQEPSLQPNHREALPPHVCTPDRHNIEALAIAPIPGSSSSSGGSKEEATPSTASSTTQSGTRFLSALEHQQLCSAPTLTMAAMDTPPYTTASQLPPTPTPTPASPSLPLPAHKALAFSQASSNEDQPLLQNSPGVPPPSSTTTTTIAAVAAAAAAATTGPLGNVPHPQRAHSALHPTSAAAAVEEGEHVESEEALQREMVEDLRLSMDVAFTPCGSGNGAPPVLSQSSVLREEEEEGEGSAVGRGSPRTSGMLKSLEEVEGRAMLTPVGSGVQTVSGEAGVTDGGGAAVQGVADQLSIPPVGDDSVKALGEGVSTIATDSCLPFSSPSWPLHEAPTPPLPAPFVGDTRSRQPPSTMATAAAVSANATGNTGSRHRTVFTFASLKAAAGGETSSCSSSLPSAPAAPSPAAVKSPQPAIPPPPFPSCLVAEQDAEGERSILLPPAFVTSQQRMGEEAQQAPPHKSVAVVTATWSEAEEVQKSMRVGWGVVTVVGGDDSASGPPSAPHPPLSPAGENTCTAPTVLKNYASGTTPSAVSPQLPTLRASEAVSPLRFFPPTMPPATITTTPNTATGSISRRRRTCFTLYSNGAAPPGTSPNLSAVGEDIYPSNSNSLSLPPPTAESTAAAAAPGAVGRVTEPHTTVEEASTISAAPAEKRPFRYAVSGAATASVVALPEEDTPLRTAAVAVVGAPAAQDNERSAEAMTAPAAAAPPTPSTSLPSSPQPREPSFHTAAAEAKESPVVPLPPSTPLAAIEHAAETRPQQPHRTSPTLQTTTGSFYDLPPAMREFYEKHRGVRQLYAWQHDLLTQPEVRAGRNFIYSLPTSGGKTLVAELSLLRCVVNRRRSGIFVLPFVSLAEEKTLALQPLTAVFDFAVDGHYGSSGRFPLCEAPAIYVCTIEKANSLLNYMLEEGRTREIGAVVVDELHMVGESRRGATLELFLSKLLLIDGERQEQRAAAAPPAAAATSSSQQQQQQKSSGQRHSMDPAEEDEEGWPDEEGMGHTAASVQPLPHSAHVFVDPGPLQIIGMSATIPNLSTLAEWLHAACFERDFRPVPLHTYSVVGGLVLRDGQTNERNLSGASVAQHLLELATEIPEASVLVFCASRQQCVDTARGIVRDMKAQAIAGQQLPEVPRSGTATTAATAFAAAAAAAAPVFLGIGADFTELDKPSSVSAVPAQMSAAIRSLLADLEALAHHEATQLSEIVPHGVAFHHGGLLAEERELIEHAFRRKHVRILCSTSTLAAGVNLPARRVIIKTPYVGRDFLTKSRYLQMCGRAGRAGLDPYGESYLLLTRRDQSRGSALMKAAVEPCRSQILEDDQTLTRSLLECIAVGLVTDTASARAWSASLLSCHAVGPVDAVWRHYLLPAAPLPPATGEAAPLSSSADPTVVLAPPSSTTTTIVNAESENSRSAPQPPSPTVAVPPSVPLSALAAMTGASLATLNRCGLVVTSPLPSPLSAAAAVVDDEEAEQGRESLPLQVRVTPFGSSSVRSCFNVEEALLLREELDELRHTGLILSDDLHLCYFLTPLREVGECDWAMLRLMMSRMSDSRQRIASLLGVDAYFIDQQAMGLGGPLQVTEEGRRRLFTAKRFYVALMLADVLAEVPMPTVEQRYNVNRGQLQNLMRSASMFSSSITSFCHAMEWYSLEAVLSSFVKRLGFGVKPDLLPLMEVRGMQPPRARALWNAGFKKLSAIAAADADDMVAKVKALNPSDSKSAKFFTKRSALMVIREAHLTLQTQIKEKKGELQELTVRRGAAQ